MRTDPMRPRVPLGTLAPVEKPDEDRDRGSESGADEEAEAWLAAHESDDHADEDAGDEEAAAGLG